MWSLLHLSRPSSTSTSMCTRAMIAPQWSLALAQMRSSSIWMCAMLAAVKLFGVCICLQCRSIPPHFCLQVHLPGHHPVTLDPDAVENVQKELRLPCKPAYHTHSLHGSNLMLRVQPIVTSSIRTSPPGWSGTKMSTSGLPESQAPLHLGGCIMPTPLLESIFTFIFFSPLSEAPPPLMTFIPLRAFAILLSKRPALHVAF